MWNLWSLMIVVESSSTNDVRKRLKIWYDSPYRFVTQALGVEPEKWQREAMLAIKNNDRVAVKSGHGVGKSALESWIVLWWLLTRYPAKVACTAPTGHQLSDVLWGEIAKWYRKLPPGLKSLLAVKNDRVELVSAPSESFAVARTARKETPEAFQGFHSENMLFMVDEASGIEPIIFEVGEGAMSTKGAKTFLAGNPTRTSGYFFDAFNKMRSYWTTMQVSCTDSNQVSEKYVEQMKEKYGVDSNIYRVRVLGDFPKDDDDSIMPLSLLEGSVERHIEIPEDEPVVWGLDVARFGSDSTALCIRQGRRVVGKVESWRGKDLMQTCGIIASKYKKTEIHPSERPQEILVDSIGLGSGVVDRLMEMGLPARGVNVAERPAVEHLYNRLRDELWFNARDWFDTMAVSMPRDEDLIDELANVKFAYTSLGKLQAESKEDMKKRGLKSPDLADAFCLTFAYQSFGGSFNKPLEYNNMGIV